MMSSVKSGSAECCYDFDCTKEYRDAWKQSWKTSGKLPEVVEADDDTDIDDDY